MGTRVQQSLAPLCPGTDMGNQPPLVSPEAPLSPVLQWSGCRGAALVASHCPLTALCTRQGPSPGILEQIQSHQMWPCPHHPR